MRAVYGHADFRTSQADAFVSTSSLLRDSSCGLLGAFAKFQKATISFVTPVGLSVRPHETSRLPPKEVS